MYGFDQRDTFASFARYTFSISLFELICPICCGAWLVLFNRNDILSPERLVAALNQVSARAVRDLWLHRAQLHGY